jgi:alcohol dehydrogenase (cytochrome c)
VTAHVYALDAKDGHMVWRFDVVPGTGSARATWTNSKYPISGGAFWTSFTLDEPNGVLYVPAGNRAPDFDSARRTGDNLYTDSVIAIDAATGRMLGYNQLVKRDSYDWDVDSPPTLATTRSGKRIVASANKDGLLSILDRSRVTRGATPADLTAVLPLLSQTPTTSRENVDVPLSRDHAVRFCPGIQGSVEWNGAAFSPDSNSLFVAAVDWCTHVQVKRDLEVPASGGLGWLGNENPTTDMYDPVDQAKGWLTAFDAETGSVRWKYHASHPMLAGVTPTAGGLVFAPDLGGQIYAVDADTRKHPLAIEHRAIHRRWHCRAGGRQLIGVASGMKSPVWPGGAQQSRILVYGLR